MPEGGEVGPDLSDVAGKFSKDLLIESVLEPSRQIVDGYRTSIVVTTAGLVLTGIVQGRVGRCGTTLVDVEGRIGMSFGRLTLRNEEFGVASIMPTGLVSLISRQEFADVIAYLETLRPTTGITLPTGFSSKIVVKGITGATAMEVAADGQIFICEQTGALRRRQGRHTAGRTVRHAESRQPVGARFDRRRSLIRSSPRTDLSMSIM